MSHAIIRPGAQRRILSSRGAHLCTDWQQRAAQHETRVKIWCSALLAAACAHVCLCNRCARMQSADPARLDKSAKHCSDVRSVGQAAALSFVSKHGMRTVRSGGGGGSVVRWSATAARRAELVGDQHHGKVDNDGSAGMKSWQASLMSKQLRILLASRCKAHRASYALAPPRVRHLLVRCESTHNEAKWGCQSRRPWAPGHSACGTPVVDRLLMPAQR